MEGQTLSFMKSRFKSNLFLFLASHTGPARTQKSIKLWGGAGAIVVNLMNDLSNRYSNDPVVQVMR